MLLNRRAQKPAGTICLLSQEEEEEERIPWTLDLAWQLGWGHGQEWLGTGHAVKGARRHACGHAFCDVAYLMSGPRLHSQNHCKNDHIVIVL